MTRIGTGFCVAAMLGCVVTVGAQTPTSTDQRSSATAQSGDISVTGCVAKAADGSYTLTNARMDNEASSTTASGSGSSTTATSGTTAGTTGSTSGTTGSTAGTTGTASSSPSASGGMNSASTWVLSGGSDLEKHVGHKVQVTGRSAASSASSASSGGTTSTTTATSGTTAGSTAGSATGTTGEASPSSSSSASQRRLDVQSVKMISSSCS